MGQIFFVHAQKRVMSGKDAIGLVRHNLVAMKPHLLHTRLIGQARGSLHRVSYAYVRGLPEHSIAQASFLAAHDTDMPRSGGCVEEDDGISENDEVSSKC